MMPKQRNLDPKQAKDNLFGVDNRGLETLELGDVDDRDLGVELLVGGRVVVVVTPAVEADADAVRDRLDAVAPDGRVDGRVEEDLLGAHRLLSKGADSLDRRGSAVLEALAVDGGVEADGVLAGDNVRQGAAGLALGVVAGHFDGLVTKREGEGETPC